MRVLFVVTRFPYPPWRGDQVRSYHLLRCLAPTHEITLVLAGAAPGERAMAELTALGVEVHQLDGGRLRGVALTGRAVWDRRPIQVLPYTGAAQRRTVTRLAAGHDLVHAHLLRAAPLIEGIPNSVVDLVDALSLNLLRRAEHDHGLAALAARVESRRLRRYEQRVVAQSAATIVSSADDADHLGGGQVVIPNGVDLARFPFVAGPRTEPVIVFGGNLGYFPNVDAARTLAEQVLPAVQRRVPEARLVLAGARPAGAVRRLAGRQVTVVATPDDLAAVLGAAAVTVIPIRAGSGIQNKVLEAMAVGTPVVTTTRAAAAIGATSGVHLLTADDAAGAARAAVQILSDAVLAGRLREAAHRHVMESFTWERAATAVSRVWDRVAGSSPASEA